MRGATSAVAWVSELTCSAWGTAKGATHASPRTSPWWLAPWALTASCSGATKTRRCSRTSAPSKRALGRRWRWSTSPSPGLAADLAKKDAGDGQPGTVVHLTMYGIPHRQAIPQIRRDRPLTVVVGGAKVPAEAFSLAHHNVSVGQQPHSEVAALALFLDAWTEGAGLTGPSSTPTRDSPERSRQEGHRRRVNPSPSGKFWPQSLLKSGRAKR